MLEKGRDGAMLGALEQRLAHMGNVEQPGGFAGMQVLGQDSRGILDRHVVAGERPHARAKLDMQGVERGLLGRGFGHRSASREKAPALARQAADRGFKRWRTPPLSDDLRDFPLLRGYPRRWANANEPRAPLSRASSLQRSLMPERFRGGCAFGAGVKDAGLFREVSSTDACELA